jgi:hypothetical protein
MAVCRLLAVFRPIFSTNFQHVRCYYRPMKKLLMLSLVLVFSASAFAQPHHHHHHSHHYHHHA